MLHGVLTMADMLPWQYSIHSYLPTNLSFIQFMLHGVLTMADMLPWQYSIHSYLPTNLSFIQFMLHGVLTMADMLPWQYSIHSYLPTNLSFIQFMLHGVLTMADMLPWQYSIHSWTWNKQDEYDYQVIRNCMAWGIQIGWGIWKKNLGILLQNKCCGYSKETVFRVPKQIFKVKHKKITTLLCYKHFLICNYEQLSCCRSSFLSEPLVLRICEQWKTWWDYANAQVRVSLNWLPINPLKTRNPTMGT